MRDGIHEPARIDRFQLSMRVMDPVQRHAVLREGVHEPRSLTIFQLADLFDGEAAGGQIVPGLTNPRNHALAKVHSVCPQGHVVQVVTAARIIRLVLRKKCGRGGIVGARAGGPRTLGDGWKTRMSVLLQAHRDVRVQRRGPVGHDNHEGLAAGDDRGGAGPCRRMVLAEEIRVPSASAADVA